MLKPQIPENEKERQKEVQRYNLAEDLPNASLESIVEIASEICKMPISLISIVDRDRQFFKVKRGLLTKETPRDISFCAHAIHKPDELFIVEDTSQDERFADNPLVTGAPYIKFYAGIPILSPDNYPIGTVCVIDNKSNTLSEKQLNALKHLGKQVTLILELQKRNQQLELAEKKLKVQATDMEDYAHLVSHDLKEPVRSIRSFLELFIRKYGNQLNEEGEQYIEFSYQGAIKINQLIEDLLHFSKIARVEGELKPVDLNEVMQNVIESIQLQNLGKKAEININNSLPLIQGIESGMIQLFYNLINNSIKFVTQSETPIIEITSETTESGIIVKLKDNGIGIPKSQLKNIFNIFRRVSPNKDVPGTGVGLAIVKKIAEIHNASIEVKSEVGKGSEFILLFPKL